MGKIEIISNVLQKLYDERPRGVMVDGYLRATFNLQFKEARDIMGKLI